MTLALGVIAASPAGEEGTHEREVAHDFVLVDFQPADTGGDESMMEESDDGTSGETPEESNTSGETPMEETDTESTEFTYENCDAARDAGAAPIQEGAYGFGPHLDADNDGIGCENWSGAAQAPQDSQPAQAPEGSQYKTCTEAKADGATDIPATDDRYAEDLDRDKDGIACES